MAGNCPYTRPARPRARACIVAAACLTLALGACNSVADREIEKAQAEMKPGMGELSSPEALMRVAEHTSRGGDLRSAITFYYRASMAAPDNPEPIVRMAELMDRLGGRRDAEAAYGRALSIDPKHVEALHGLGNVLVALDRPEEAIQHYRAALEIESNPRTISGLGVALDMSGQHKKAQENYRAGLVEFPASLSLRNNLGLSLALTGQVDEAVKMLREVATHPAANARHRQNLALAYGLAGKPELAAELGRLDLEVGEVRKNLDYYSWLRQQTQKRAMEAFRAGSNTAEAPPAPAPDSESPASELLAAESPAQAPRDIRRK
jgi:Flp pilus assembly protein TadD